MKEPKEEDYGDRADYLEAHIDWELKEHEENYCCESKSNSPFPIICSREKRHKGFHKDNEHPMFTW